MNTLSEGIIVVGNQEIKKGTPVQSLYENPLLKITGNKRKLDFKYLYFATNDAYIDGEQFALEGTVYNHDIVRMDLVRHGDPEPAQNCLGNQLGESSFNSDFAKVWQFPWGEILVDEAEITDTPHFSIGYI